MQLMHVKLKSGADIIAYIINENQTTFTIKDPVEFRLDPHHGIYGLEWLFLSDISVGILNKVDIMFINGCSIKGAQFYNEFVNRYHTIDNKESEIFTSDLESMFAAMLESKASTKH